jgi:hypothetical protein
MVKAKKKHEPVKIHRGHTWLLERGIWGPHTARYICASCDGVFVKWVSTKTSTKSLT